MLDLVRLSPRRLFPPGGVDLFRQIAVLTEMSEGDEVLGVACGKGVALGYFAEELLASDDDATARLRALVREELAARRPTDGRRDGR